MEKEITFIHAADLHLDSPFKGMSSVPESIFSEIRQSTFAAFDHLIEEAIERQVDFVLLVGDLFDNEKQSLKAQVHLRDAFKKLHRHGINVYLSYGNHDFIKGNRHPMTYPENVFIFTSEDVSSFTFKKHGEEIAKIYGFSYENRALLGDKSGEFMKENDEIPFHIGMLHGTLYGNKDHDPYAPFQLNELKDKQFDYWALGHIHKRTVLSEAPAIVYSGNIQGRHRHELGEKGCYHVTLNKLETKLQFLPLQKILFENMTVDVSECQTIHELEAILFNELKEADHAQLVHITFTGESAILYEWHEAHLFTEMIELVNEVLLQKEAWLFIYKYKLKYQNKRALEVNDFFMNEFNKSVDELSIRTAMEQLLHHRDARKYVSMFKEDEIADIKEKAKQLILNELYERGD